MQGIDCDGEGRDTEWSAMGTFTTLAGMDYPVAAATVWESNNPEVPVNGWVFIASPVSGSIAPTAVAHLMATPATDYDLYRFNQSAANGKEWENYKATTSTNHADFTSLVNGQGYLYATKETKTLVFSGTFNTDNTKTVDLVYNNTAELAGWNLVGNPFAVDAYINRPFYKMNAGGTGIEVIENYNNYTTAQAIPVCTGIVVKADSDNESVTFSTTAPSLAAPNNGSLNIALSQVVEPVVAERGRSVETPTRNQDGPSTLRQAQGPATLLDKAIVSFNEGSKLGKFYFGTQNANIYIPQHNEEYAIAFSEGQGEMPLNFKAKEDGTYTLSVNPEGVEMAYLHLIDNMTGADVDLLAHAVPELVEGHAGDGTSTGSATSYTFTAKTTDYESRFKLVFAVGSSTGSDTFAFISNGNIIVNGGPSTGSGTLQIVDVMGRIVRVCTDGVHTVSTSGMTPGVYVLRLINGNDVKTQKIVVR